MPRISSRCSASRGVWVLWRAIRRDKMWLFSAAGVLLGLAFLMKQQGVFLPCFGGLATLLSCRQRRPFLSLRHLCRMPDVCRRSGLALRPSASGFGWRARSTSSGSGPSSMRGRTSNKCRRGGDPGVLAERARGRWGELADLGVGGHWGDQPGTFPGRPGTPLFLFGFLLFSFLCVCPGFYFRQHYFIVFLPCVAILAGIGSVAVVGAVFRLPRRPGSSRRARSQPQISGVDVAEALKTAVRAGIRTPSAAGSWQPWRP